jgi:hypothetical protein
MLNPRARFEIVFILQLVTVLFAFTGATVAAAPVHETIPDDFPRFVVPGHAAEMEALRQLFWHHYQTSGPQIPVWDAWLPMSTLWPASGDAAGPNSMRQRWTAALESRIFDAEGYVSSQQHDGPAHTEGWPFPTWSQAGGIGWHYAPVGVVGYEPRRATTDGWQLTAAHGDPITDRGWPIEFLHGAQTVTIQTPSFSIDAKISPWLRLNWWAIGLDGANCYVEWTTRDSPKFSAERRIYFPLAGSDLSRLETRTMIRMYRHAGWRGRITGLRLGFELPGGVTNPSARTASAKIVVKSFHTACDTRQNVNDSNFIRALHDYFLWTGDVDFLRGQIDRAHTAIRYNIREFQTREHHCIYTTWPGHDGRSGLKIVEGQPIPIRGQGVGNNYWDLLPFGGEDALATIYHYDALLDLAELEDAIQKNPQSHIDNGDPRSPSFAAADLRRQAQQVKDYGTRRFWNPATGRFGTVDLTGQMHDYGFTFLNNEAVYYNFATPDQARSIHAWMSGQRTVAGDTATGADIYHWRFGPRSTTRRNLDYYFWGWQHPESLQFGDQVQDGGAVLGFSFHDLMARLKTAGPDDAAKRLQAVTSWYSDVQAGGGYREYYAVPGRGKLQGGHVAGGLGVDREFFESILVPQVMLYGFLGFRPTADGCVIDPHLPSDWPELTITRIHLHDHVLDIRATRDQIEVSDHTPTAAPLKFNIPPKQRLAVKT